MKLIKLIILFLVGTLTVYETSGQANAYINVLTQNGGVVNMGGTVFIEVAIGNSGPVADIPAGKIRAQISVPGSIVSIPVTGHVLPAGWTILSNSGTSIQVCNSSDIIPLFEERTILIKVQGDNAGGPSTIIGQLDFRNNCTNPGSLTGDDASDNSSTTTIQVIPSCPLTVTASAGTIACNGGTTTLTATVTNASGAVEYRLNGGPFQSGNTFTVNAAGSPYTVTAREVSTPACAATATVTVTEPSIVTAPVVATITQPNCTTATGSVNLSGLPAGNWTINPGAISGNTVTTTISGLAPGTYSFTVTNAAGCTSTASANIIINAQPATPTTPAAGTITQPTCAISTGSVVLSGLPSGNWTVNPGAIPGNTTTATINGLASGTYNFTVTNGEGCTSAASADVVINNVPGAPPAPTYNVNHPTCTVATGTITITSATSGFTFSLDGGIYATYPSGGYVVAAGSHTLTAQNASSCTSPVDNITVNAQPPTPAAPTVSVVQPSCTVATGVITITSATSGFTYSLDGGAYAAYPIDGYSVAAGSSHTLTAQSTAGCVSAITNIAVNVQPASPTATASAGTIACFGGTTTITVIADGGIAPYEYSLDGVTFQTGNTFTVSAGTYSVTVRDLNLCTGTTAPLTVTQPIVISATASSGAIVCNGGTVTIAVSATGGTGALQYSLNNGPFQPGNTFTVSAGTYIVTVKDANNCTAITSAVTVTQPATLTASATAKRIAQCGGTAEVTVTASGGTAPYTSGIGVFTKGPGTWSFPVMDAVGCTATREITIEAPGCMNLRVYPNPAKNSITVNHSIAEPGSIMQVFEINGALVLSKAVPQNAFQTIIDVSRLAAASYVLVFLNGNDKKETLFVKVSSN